MSTFTKHYEEIKQIASHIFDNPELGYKEQKTHQTVLEYLLEVNPELTYEVFCGTGIKTTLGTGKPLNLGFIAELDAVYAPSHFHADQETGAAHNCGHYTQVAIALALYKHYFTTKAYESLDFALTFIFVPAEEYLDLPYRDALKAKGEITYYGGKPEAMKRGVFDDIDLGVCVHSMGGEYPKRTIEINCDLAGFLYKKYTFKGRASHAGFDPSSGTNAYSMSTLFNVALGMQRQHFKDAEKVRMNPIVMQSDMSTNVIPNQITVGTDLRTQSVEYMKDVAKQMDQAAKGSALAMGGEVEASTQMGYLPFVQDRYLSEFAMAAFKENEAIEEILTDNAISAAGDIGDLSFMMPCIQIGYSGFTGTIHGDDFKDIDPKFIYEIFPRYLTEVFNKMSGQLDKTRIYRRSFADYEALLSSITE